MGTKEKYVWGSTNMWGVYVEKGVRSSESDSYCYYHKLQHC